MREYDLSDARWRKSTYSDAHGGECLEVLDNAAGGVVPVRDSKNPAGPVLVVGAGAWRVFVADVSADG
ncbi:DUF397 domain-containing protein [Streptomyces sp. NPDC015131]|uniref:DUF397 domain-containing protein n=1 Tax=Streptomyces sp. NPDC015131 TaxID=3364941 RepID=UPI0036FB6205